MENPSLQIGNNNWAVKDGSILGYNIIQDNYLPQPIDFTRASSATRVNAEGLIETASILGSELIVNGDFADGSANWGNYINGSSTIVFTDVATLNIDASNSNVGIYQENVFTSGKQYKIVLKMKASSSFDAEILETQQASTISTIGSVSLTTSYQNFTFYFTATGTNDIFIHRKFSAASANQSITIDNVSVKEYTTLNVPRIDYTGGGFGKLLLEPQRTNLVTYSEDFSNAAWSKLNAGTGTAPSITANYAISPDGTQNATRIVLDKGSGPTSGDYSAITDVITLSGDGSFSIYLKSNTGTDYIVSQRLEDDRQQITITSEWQRFVFSASSLINGTSGLWLRGGYGSDDYADILVWAAQTENASYATSYIPTSGTAVTRVKDSASKTGISSLIGQTEGTLFAEVEIPVNTQDGDIIAIRNGTGSANGIFVSYRSSSVVQLIVRTGSTNALIFQRSGSYAIGTNKIAVAYKNGDFAISLNGTAAQVNTSSITMPTSLDSVALFGDNMYAQTLPVPYAQALLFKTRLTNAELATLTTI